VAVAARDRRGEDNRPGEDLILAEALLAGDPSAAKEAWRRFSPPVRVTLRRMLGPGGDLEDLIQDVFLRFFDALCSLRSVESIRAFITGIAIRRAQEELRRREVRRRFSHLLPAFLRPRTTELDDQSRDAVAHLYRVLDTLSPDERTLYVLRYIQGMDHARLADALGVSVPTVRRRLERLTLRMDELVKADPVLADYATEDDLETADEEAGR
jgi:RNA polymerase sigma-70 factor, ECF subfamily